MKPEPSPLVPRIVRWTLRGLLLAVLAWACHGKLTEPPLLPAPQRPSPGSWSADEVNVAWLGHASVLIGFRGALILTDPAFYERIGVTIGTVTIGPRRLVESALGPDALPRVDAVLVSHAHMDSLDRPSLESVDAPLVIVPERTRDLVDDLGYERVAELRWGETIEAGGVTIEAIEVAHWGRRWPWERWRGYNGYLLSRDGVTLLFASDTAYTPAIGALARERGIDAAILGNGAYDPWIRNHADPEQVWRMFRESGAHTLLPIHWDTFRLGKEPIGDAMRRLYAAAGDDADRIAIRRVGDTWTLR